MFLSAVIHRPKLVVCCVINASCQLRVSHALRSPPPDLLIPDFPEVAQITNNNRPKLCAISNVS